MPAGDVGRGKRVKSPKIRVRAATSWIDKRRKKKTPPTLPELAPHEREAASFWYRRIATSLLIGNGAGVIAVGGFLGKSDSLAFAAPIVYPALSLFLTGVAFGFASLFGNMLWAAFRIEAYTEFYAQLEKLGRVKGKEQVAAGVVAVFIVLLLIAQMVFLAGAGVHFYLGSAQVVYALGKTACQADASAEFCRSPPSFMYGNPNERTLLPKVEAEAARYEVVPTFVERARPGTVPMNIVERLNIRSSSTQFSEVTSEYIFRIGAAPRKRQLRGDSCIIAVTNWYLGDAPPLRRNPDTERFLQYAAKPPEGFSIEPVVVEVSFKATSADQTGFQVLRWDATETALRSVSDDTNFKPHLRGIPSSLYKNGLLVYREPTNENVSLACMLMVGEAGFEVSYFLELDIENRIAAFKKVQMEQRLKR